MDSAPTQTIQVGDKAPEFVLPSLDGDPVRLQDYLGTKLVLFIWASW